MLKRRDGFTTFFHDGRICLKNSASEQVLRGFAFGSIAETFVFRIEGLLFWNWNWKAKSARSAP